MVHGHDLDHLVSTRLPPNRVAVGFRLLARTLAIGLQIQAANGRPAVIREPRAFRTAQVDGLGLFEHYSGVIRRGRGALPAPPPRWAPECACDSVDRGWSA